MKNESRLFSWLFSKKVPPVTPEEERIPYRWTQVNPFMRLGFWWLWPILLKGYKRTLLPQDLWTLTPELTTKVMHDAYEINLNNLLKQAKARHLKKNPDLTNFEWPSWIVAWALFLTFKWQYSWSCICLALSFCCQALSPLITRRLIDFVELRFFNIETNYNKGIGYTFGSVILIFLNGLTVNHFFHCAMMTGAQSKAILTKSLLLKSFTLSARSRYIFPIGRITSLMSTDLSRIDLAIGFQPLIICFPIPVIIAVVLLLVNIGVPALAGIGLFIVSLVICVLLTGKLFSIRETVVKYTDQRIGLMREVLSNLKVIKFYAWELAYKLNIADVRQKEMKHLFTIKVLRNFITAYAVTLPILTSMVSFITMWASNRMKSPGEVFSSLSLFSILAQAIMLVPVALATGADAYIGFTRVTDFLSASQYNEDLEKKLDDANEKFYINAGSLAYGEGNSSQISQRYESPDPTSENAIEIKDAHFIWESFHDQLEADAWDLKQARQKLMKKEKHALKMDEKDNFYSNNSNNGSNASYSDKSINQFPGLTNINLDIKRGEFIIITGIIGSGKSSLLSAMAGFMKLNSGELNVNDDLILCSNPWIQNATVRENILFGEQFDPAYYKRVIHACALEEDLDILPARDLTEIGERGITLSGGQKARINLARAVYSQKQIFLFDDVISAVDSRVGGHIVKHLFQGLLKNKTVILATHQLGIIDSADRVVFLNGNGSADVGTVPDLLQRNELFERLIEFSKDHEIKEAAANPDLNPEKMSKGEEVQLIQQQSYTEQTGEDDLLGRITLDEESATNAISWDVYKKYISLGSGIFGWTAFPVFIVLVAIATFFQVFTNTWLSYWMEKKWRNKTDKFYVGIYVGLTFLTVIFTAIEFTMLAYLNNNAAELLNVKAVAKVLHVPMSYMDTTPMGRILNRFTKDTDTLDNEICEQMRLFIFPLALIIGIVVLCISYLPWFAIFVPFLIFGFVFFSNFYQGSSREIKRLEATQRSLVYNNFNETLTGMNTIQAFRAEHVFVEKNDRFLDNMNEAYYLSVATQRWLCVHLDILASAFALVICMLCITEQFNISASSTGLLLSYVIQIVGLLSLTVRAMTEVENEMNSVERLHNYAFELPQEAPYQKTEFTPPTEWPSSGYIEFDHVSLKYRPNLPHVLKDMNLFVYPGEKVGICGRTGAGKSSIMTALYRLVELDEGSIRIDGLNIADMGLRDLRSKLSIIPQDPVLFHGSIRKNLDPSSQYSDDLLWDSLRRCGLIEDKDLPKLMKAKHDVENSVGYDDLHKFHLDQLVEDDGTNFSLGERQLIALARALVRNSKILILDEATSSVDFGTDLMIQETIAREFGHCTILCIAHRLKTIVKYDRIIVMDKGKIVEKGTPRGLFDAYDHFRSMCDKANITSEDF
ncbi:P-loop containing nucleoside triphosphate hydrolase protein [Suhomyces tanzawaensis NRRL Y-17324]|uniref:p-loop containing nucleoside triphosphate hydrolase protein n=1 Tax=Suhomyces tanzawaensis NRRL Y-17324 TaxID=984487 RepID=A0A1E4SSR1_9ASCO|nr:P-loop containing nucleoside triphosphate hydrolase protein [Suhomyces tanzawaensis NRRL Y-17324]ODV82432.1 P-loop containing nucleoside triphosphate hydrolase protein [Suhomyces tanzawaensis NRRL Y-17324]